MATDITGPVWLLDTAETVTTKNVVIQKMWWYPNAADNDLIINDRGGKLIWRIRAIAASANYESIGREEFDPGPDGLPASGIVVNTIDGGVVHAIIK